MQDSRIASFSSFFVQFFFALVYNWKLIFCSAKAALMLLAMVNFRVNVILFQQILSINKNIHPHSTITFLFKIALCWEDHVANWIISYAPITKRKLKGWRYALQKKNCTISSTTRLWFKELIYCVCKVNVQWITFNWLSDLNRLHSEKDAIITSNAYRWSKEWTRIKWGVSSKWVLYYKLQIRNGCKWTLFIATLHCFYLSHSCLDSFYCFTR